MDQIMQKNEAAPDWDNDIGLMDILAYISQKRKLLLSLTAIIATLIFGFVFLTKCQYTSDGFLRAPWKLTEYNSHKAALADKEILRRFLEANHLQANPNGKYLLGSISENFLQQHVHFVLPYSKEDLRNLGEVKDGPDPAALLGFTVSFMSSSPQEAQERVKIVGDFIKDTMLQQDIVETIRTTAANVEAKQQQIDNQLIQKKLALEEALRKLEAVKGIASRYPDASRMDSRQLLSTNGDGSRYLSPVAQLVGIESEIADIKTEQSRLERSSAQNALRQQFYARAVEISHQPKTGKAMLTDLVTAYKDVFKDKDTKVDETREVFNQITILVDKMQFKYLLEPRFSSGPTLPDHRSGPGKLQLALLALFGGFFLSCIGVLATSAFKQASTGSAPATDPTQLAS